MRIYSFFSFFIIANLCAAQSSIVGKVRLFRSGKTPLENVEVYSIEGANTVYTNDKGYFELTFPDKEVGDIINEIEFLLEGYLLINEPNAKNIIIPKNPTAVPLEFVMSSEKLFRKQKGIYYGIIKDRAEEAYDEKSNQLLGELKELQNKINLLTKDNKKADTFQNERRILLQQIDDLQNEKNNLIKNAAKYAQLFAEINTDESSDIAVQALKIFEQGDVKKALEIMNEKTLAKDLKNAKLAIKEVNILKVKAEKKLEKCINDHIFKARLFAADLQFDSAYVKYKVAIEADNRIVQNLIEMADFCSDLNNQKEAINYYQKATAITKDSALLVVLFDKVGTEYMYDGKYEQSLASFQQSLRITKTIYANDEQELRLFSNKALHHIAKLRVVKREYNLADSLYHLLLNSRNLLVPIDSIESAKELADTYHDFGVSQHHQRNYIKAENAYKSALQIREKLAAIFPEKYTELLALTYNNLGIIYYTQKKYEEAGTIYDKTLEIRKELVKQNPEGYAIDLAVTHNNIGILNLAKGSFKEAEVAYLKALEILSELSKTNPDRYLFLFSKLQYNIGIFYADLGDFVKAEQAYIDALTIRKNLSEIDPDKYKIELSKCANTIAKYHKSRLEENGEEKNLIQALKYCSLSNEALLHYQEKSKRIENEFQKTNKLKAELESLSKDDLVILRKISELDTIYNGHFKKEKIEEYIAQVSGLFILNPSNKVISKKILNKVEAISWKLLTQSRFKEAEIYGKEIIKLNADFNRLKKNVSIALLFQDSFTEAIEVATDYLTPNKNGKNQRDHILKTLEQLKTKDITHSDTDTYIDNLNKFIKEKHP